MRERRQSRSRSEIIRESRLDPDASGGRTPGTRLEKALLKKVSGQGCSSPLYVRIYMYSVTYSGYIGVPRASSALAEPLDDWRAGASRPARTRSARAHAPVEASGIPPLGGNGERKIC